MKNLNKKVQAVHRFSSPMIFFKLFHRYSMPFFFIAILMVMLSLFWGLAIAPEDYQQGNSYRIIYIHVPAAIIAQSAYYIMAACAISVLVWKIKLSSFLIEAIAPIGACFCLIAITSGAIWGKPTWGTWWVWDARLTSVLILLMLYIAIISMQQLVVSKSLKYKSTAMLCLVGSINLPIIKFSVNWWNTLHQPASITLTDKPAIANDMLMPLLFSIISFYLLFISLVIISSLTIILKNEMNKKWVKQLFYNN